MYRVRRLARFRAMVAATAFCGVALSGCTSGLPDSEQGLRVEDDQAVAYKGLLPNLCDELLSPVTVAAALGGPLGGQRSYVYQAPSVRAGRLRGMTCEYGIDQGGPRFSVSAQEYVDRTAASSRYSIVTDGEALGDAEAIRVLARPGVLGSSPDAASLAVLDGPRTLEFSIRRSSVPLEQMNQALLEVAGSVVERMAGDR